MAVPKTLCFCHIELASMSLSIQSTYAKPGDRDFATVKADGGPCGKLLKLGVKGLTFHGIEE